MADCHSTRSCVQCGAEFVRRTTAHRYCSGACQDAARVAKGQCRIHNTRNERACKSCSAVFKPARNNQRHCSPECRARHNTKKLPAGETYDCLCCGANIALRINQGTGLPSVKARKYCSRRCEKAAGRAKQTKRIYAGNRKRRCSGICPGCNQSFTRIRWGDDGGLYCSKACYQVERTRLAVATQALRPFVVISHHGHCAQCGKHYRKGQANSTVCSAECSAKRNNEKARAWFAAKMAARVLPDRTCLECACTFSPARLDSVFCTLRCARRKQRRASAAARDARRRGAGPCDSIDPIKVFIRDKWRCHICKALTLKAKRGTCHERAPELDHLVTLAEGGTHTWGNVACSCRKCNGAKNSRSMGQLGFNLAA